MPWPRRAGFFHRSLVLAIGAVFPSVNARDARAREPEHLLGNLFQRLHLQLYRPYLVRRLLGQLPQRPRRALAPCPDHELALNASGTWHCTLRQAELLLDDLQQLSDVVGELSAVLAQAKATVTSRGGHAHLSTQARP